MKYILLFIIVMMGISMFVVTYVVPTIINAQTT